MKEEQIKRKGFGLKFWYRPKIIHVYLQDSFTEESVLVLSVPYNPIEFLRGKLRKQIVKIKSIYNKEKWLVEHNPLKFSGATLNVKLKYEF